MSKCEDWPCCGHEPGCCPDFDEDGNQLNMVCVCGAKLPVDNRVSICDSCLNQERDHDRDADVYFDEDDDYDDDWDDDDFEDAANRHDYGEQEYPEDY